MIGNDLRYRDHHAHDWRSTDVRLDSQEILGDLPPGSSMGLPGGGGGGLMPVGQVLARTPVVNPWRNHGQQVVNPQKFPVTYVLFFFLPSSLRSTDA